jgi:hypothetical protein
MKTASPIKATLLALSAALVLLNTACVERKLLIRSEPSGAPVTIDEKEVGTTPLDYEFTHYGTRRIRVGPVRDEKGAVAFAASEKMVPTEAPTSQTFPLGFFWEVLWPKTLVDEHPVSFTLKPPTEEYGEKTAKDVMNRAREFRKKALSPAPEEQD